MKAAVTPPAWPNGKPRSMDNAFSILYAPRARVDAYQPPKKPGPKPSKLQQSVLALMTEGERKTARLQREGAIRPCDISTTSHKSIQGANHAAH